MTRQIFDRSYSLVPIRSRSNTAAVTTAENTMYNSFLYSIADAAKALSIGRTKLLQMLARGELASVQIGTRRLITVKSIKTLIGEEHTGDAA